MLAWVLADGDLFAGNVEHDTNLILRSLDVVLRLFDHDAATRDPVEEALEFRCFLADQAFHGITMFHALERRVNDRNHTITLPAAKLTTACKVAQLLAVSDGSFYMIGVVCHAIEKVRRTNRRS